MKLEGLTKRVAGEDQSFLHQRESVSTPNLPSQALLLCSDKGAERNTPHSESPAKVWVHFLVDAIVNCSAPR